ncbi:SMP-30/gluconolactonase/LRE family protein [Candidimonas nitroreducens]|uniref:Gluconolactonase n=1 Tax=Candidimonas nitroreducens TaxID=683354 RepID=A0A225MCG0_9BURK|nr:SMP-30/gluconolactonase/LRE family protein [Candidimonas nitroreducens]OWT58964.1 gluconolactonase [Candidimonas nitroreducens]
MYANDLLESAHPQRIATGYVFTEGPLWDPRGYFYFADVRDDKLYRIKPGGTPELVRQTTNGNGTTFDLQGRIVQCEGLARRLTRWDPQTDKAEILVDNIDGKKLNRPNDVICRSDGSLLFTDPDKRVDVKERELDAAIWRLAPDGSIHLVANCEYPNGLAYSPDERHLYVANTRFMKYLHVIAFDAQGNITGRRIIGDMTFDQAEGVPDGVKVDALGRVYCTGPGGIWVFTPEGERVGIIKCTERPVNFTFGGDDLKTLYICALTSVYTLRVRVPGLPSPWHKKFQG